MNLSKEQKETVAKWLSEGDSLSDIQKKLDKEMGMGMTYMEVRFLVDDLDLELKDPDEPKVEEKKEEEEVVQGGVQDAQAELVGSVTVSVDKVMRPGSALSGSVTFSDGVGAAWQLDPMGRIGLIPSQEGYQPSQEDLQEFQQGLQVELQKAGFA